MSLGLLMAGVGGRKAGSGDILTAPAVNLGDVTSWPTDAHAHFALDSNGYWYSSFTVAYPATPRGPWINNPANAGNYSVRVTRTGGTESDFTSGAALNTWHSLGSDRDWLLSQTGAGFIDIGFTIELALSTELTTILSQTLSNNCSVESAL